MPLEVLHVVSHFPPDSTGGIETHVCDLVDELHRTDGVRPSVLTTYNGECPTDDYPFNVTWAKRRDLVRNAPLSPSAAVELLRQDPDLIHFHDPFHGAFLPAFVASRLRSTPIVTTEHNYGVADSPRHTAYNTLVRHPLIRQCDRVVGSTESYLTQFPIFEALGEDERQIIPHGVDTTEYSPVPDSETATLREQWGVDPDDPLILTIGALDPAHYYKRVDWLVEAHERLLETHPDAHLVIGGTGERRSQFESEAAELGVQDSVSFVGFIPSRDLQTAYTAADVFVLPTQPPESFGIVLIEAMACDTPVITSDIPGPGDVARSCGGHIFPKGDVKSLASEIRETLTDAERHPRQCVVETYDWKSITTEWMALYNDVVGH